MQQLIVIIKTIDKKQKRQQLIINYIQNKTNPLLSYPKK